MEKIEGYQPTKGHLDSFNPPMGGSGIYPHQLKNTCECDSLIDLPVVAQRCNTCGRLHIYEVIQTVGAPYKLRKVGTLEAPE